MFQNVLLALTVGPPGRRRTKPPVLSKAQEPTGVEATLNSRLVGVTAGLGTCTRVSWTGNSNTAPGTPAGVVMIADPNAHTAPIGHFHGVGCHGTADESMVAGGGQAG